MKDETNREKIGKGNPPKHTRFSKEYQPKKRGRTLGALNRKTLFGKYLEIETSEGKTNLEVIACKVIEKAKKGDLKSAQEVLDSFFGKNPDKVDMKSQNENTTKVEYYLPESKLIKNPRK